MIDKILCTSQYMNGVKKLQDKHRTDVLMKLDSIVLQLRKKEITKQYRNHPLQGKEASGAWELHVTGDVLLVYRYDTDDCLIVSLKLLNLTDHNNIGSNRDKKTKYGGEATIPYTDVGENKNA